jgi:hypothetical protein
MWELRQVVRARNQLRRWENTGKPLPPPHLVKQRIVRGFADTFKVDTFVETGTYLGDMIYAVKDRFRAIYSIELGEELADRARRRFRGYQHVQIIHGDSGQALPDLLKRISSPCLFWLDGHYSGAMTARGMTDTPVIKELNAVLHHDIKSHVILIDDARCFDGTHDYPTIAELTRLLTESRPDLLLSVDDDVIRIHSDRAAVLRTP